MAGSLFKILLFVAAIAVVSLFAAFVAESGSDVRLTLSGYEISTSPLTFAVLIVLVFPAFWLLFFLIGLVKAAANFFLGDETALTRYFNRNREQRGFEALADGLLALSSGEPKLALAKVARAESLLKRPGITGIITAQAAERAGDKSKAVLAYKKMLQDERTRFAAIAGLLKHRLEDGDAATALKLAEKAFVINPQHEDMQNILLRLQSAKEDWEGAQRTLAAKLRHRKIPRDVFRRRNAILKFASARRNISQGSEKEGGKEAAAANKELPGLVPAAVLAAEVKSRAGDRKSAESVIRKAWSIQPHPDLAAAFAALEPDESPSARKKRFENMIGKNSTHPESRMLMAELSIADRDFPAARRAIGTLPEEKPTVRSLAIIAAIERGEGSDDAVVLGWLAKAVSASRGPQWVCEICSRAHEEWVPVCAGCDGFDTLEWTEVPVKAELPETYTGLLNFVASESDSAEESGDGPGSSCGQKV